MKKKGLLVLLILFTFNLQSQNDSIIPFIAYWNMGDQYKYELVKINYQAKNGEIVKNDSNNYIIDFRVIDSTAKSYTVNWKYNNYLSDSIDFHPELSKVITDLETVDVIYETDELGSFLQIQNWRDIKKSIERLEDYIVNSNSAADSINLKRLLKPMEKAYKSKQGIEGIIFSELQVFHWLFGIELNVYDTVEYEDEIPNVLGGDPFRTNAMIYFDTVDYEYTTCSVIQTSTFNQSDFQNFLKSLIDDIVSQTSLPKKERKEQIAEIENIINEAIISIEDFNYFVFDYYYGVPIYVYTERYVVYEYADIKTKQTSSAEIILIE